MYGKHFSSMYEGSMVGAGAHVFAVWGYCISNADQDTHAVRLNPVLLSVVLGEPVDRIKDAIKYLCADDPDSCCTDEDGRRLVNTSGMEYHVVTHEQYRDIKTSSDRREYNRKYMRGYRKRKKDKDLSDDVNTCKDVSLQNLTSVSVCDSVTDFELFWKAYPKKVGKGAAKTAYKKAKGKPRIEELVKIVESQCASDQWQKDKGQFIPNPATWLNQERWEDDITSKPTDRGYTLGSHGQRMVRYDQ